MTAWSALLAPERAGDVGYWWRDDGAGGGEVLAGQDVSALLDRNRAMANHNDGWSKSRELRRVADIPAVIIDKWRNEEGLDVWNPEHGERLARKLNDPDYAWLRTAPGRLGTLPDGGFR